MILMCLEARVVEYRTLEPLNRAADIGGDTCRLASGTTLATARLRPLKYSGGLATGDVLRKHGHSGHFA